MSRYTETLERLIETLSRLPGVGRKTASRFALHLLKHPKDAQDLAQTINELQQKIKLCKRCFNISEGDLCSVCSDPGRDGGIICVVEEVHALVAIEATGVYRGLYHVLHGAISPLEGMGPKELKVQELIERVKVERPREVIIATDPDVQGEATFLYLSKVLRPLGVKITRIAQGLPAGAEIEYADPRTLSSALEGRREV
ncbi:MAG: recombination protein RecR [Deltaproteobacteria bacterium]|nr:MAG: recombination protein RecR [Deltaproteobacteria bacterium]